MDHEHRKPSSSKGNSFFHFDPVWADFKVNHASWAEARLRESDVIYRLPPVVLPTMALNLRLSEDDLLAETRFGELCLQSRGVAVCDDRPIPYRWLLPAPAPFPPQQLEAMCQLGWTEEQIGKVPKMVQIGDGIAERVESLAGRRICKPEFLEQRDRLRAKWVSLPEQDRPRLPLARTPQFTVGEAWLELKESPRHIAAFLREFERFCEKWRLLGMATWDLPDPVGPMWPQRTSTSQLFLDDAIVLRTPLDFPILETDGVGLIAREQHERSAREQGITDLKRWQTYARLLEIDHWERVLTTRYADGVRPRNFINFVEATIADLVDLDSERVQKYRKQMRALKLGRRTGLSDCR